MRALAGALSAAIALLCTPRPGAAQREGPEEGAAQEWTAPAEDRSRSNPLALSLEVIQRGRALYLQHCATCHGQRGQGRTVYLRPGDPQPRNLTDPALQARLTDGEIFWKLSTGRRLGDREYMPDFALKIPSEERRWAIVHFLRTLPAANY
jgi:mono/diheme cytochrome c family protein